MASPILMDNKVDAAIVAAAGALIVSTVFLLQGRIFYPGGIVERHARPALYWTVVLLGVGIALASLATAFLWAAPPA